MAGKRNQFKTMQDMTPTFSIVIPVYNVAPYLCECLDSVLSQTYTDWEAICVDDGSSDGSGAILDEYEKRDRRFRVLHKKNEGVSIARNTAMAIASGAYVTFLDSDDFYAHDWLERAHELIEIAPTDLVRMRFCRYDPTREPGINRSNDNQYDIVGKQNVVRWGWTELMHEGYSFLLFVKNELLKSHMDVMFPPGMRMEEDNIFCLRLLKYVKSVCQSSYAGYFYRQNPNSVVHHVLPLDYCIRFYDECLILWQEWKNRGLQDEEIRNIRQQIAYGVNVDLNWYYIDNGRRLFKGALQQHRGIWRLFCEHAMNFSAYSPWQKIRMYVFLMTASYFGFFVHDIGRFIGKRYRKLKSGEL